ncbi:hypothetical protein EJ110_NYTH22766 [Nymphaea thermarum]|nr:hypothetical protein EJ110_NYTH22766 [Nymphaea thermarum]
MVVRPRSVAGSATGASPSRHNHGEMRVRYSAIDLEDSRVTISRAAEEGVVKWDRVLAWRPFLNLPHILIDRNSDYIFRNMVAYEQRIMEDDHHPVLPVSSYLRLLSDLLVTAADACLDCQGNSSQPAGQPGRHRGVCHVSLSPPQIILTLERQDPASPWAMAFLSPFCLTAFCKQEDGDAVVDMQARFIARGTRADLCAGGRKKNDGEVSALSHSNRAAQRVEPT